MRTRGRPAVHSHVSSPTSRPAVTTGRARYASVRTGCSTCPWGRAATRASLGCAGCHEAAKASAVVAPPLTGLAKRWTVDGLVTFLATPTPPIPPVERSESDRRDLAVYLLSAHH